MVRRENLRRVPFLPSETHRQEQIRSALPTKSLPWGITPPLTGVGFLFSKRPWKKHGVLGVDFRSLQEGPVCFMASSYLGFHMLEVLLTIPLESVVLVRADAWELLRH